MRHRKQLFVDPKVQGALLLRTIGYWFFCLLTMALSLLLWRLFTGPARLFYLHFDDMLYWYGPAAVASLLVLPLVVIDCVRLSNRFAGPLYRLRRELRRLAAGEKVTPIHFRDGDFWLEFADEFNAVAKRMQELQQELNNTTGTAPIPFDSDPELQEPYGTGTEQALASTS
jgi:hypothetical protein